MFGMYANDLWDKLEMSGYWFYNARKCYGAIDYAGDLLLLAVTQFALRKIIKMYEEYVREYYVMLNGTKTKLNVVFGRNCKQINTNINDERVLKINYPGSYVYQDRNHIMEEVIPRDFKVEYHTN